MNSSKESKSTSKQANKSSKKTASASKKPKSGENKKKKSEPKKSKKKNEQQDQQGTGQNNNPPPKKDKKSKKNQQSASQSSKAKNQQQVPATDGSELPQQPAPEQLPPPAILLDTSKKIDYDEMEDLETFTKKRKLGTHFDEDIYESSSTTTLRKSFSPQLQEAQEVNLKLLNLTIEVVTNQRIESAGKYKALLPKMGKENNNSSEMKNEDELQSEKINAMLTSLNVCEAPELNLPTQIETSNYKAQEESILRSKYDPAFLKEFRNILYGDKENQKMVDENAASRLGKPTTSTSKSDLLKNINSSNSNSNGNNNNSSSSSSSLKPSVKFKPDPNKVYDAEFSEDVRMKIDAAVEGITDGDLQRLEPEIYLNDTLINFYLKLIEQTFLTDERKSRIHIFNTYFMPKMRNLFNDIGNDFKNFDKVYEKLERWTKKIDIIEKDFVMIPVCENEHWDMIVVCYPYRMYSEDNEYPFVIYLDSICRMEESYAKMLYHYMAREVKKKKPEHFELVKQKVERTKYRTFPFYQHMVPKQTNWTDCGLYLLQYTEMFAMDDKYILEEREVKLRREGDRICIKK